jgi:hypothetical protein
LQMLHAAAREPEALAELLKQHKLSSGLHKPLRKACMQDYRKKLTARFKRKNLDEQVELWEENGDDVLFGVEATDYSDSEGPGSESDGGAGGSNRAALQYMGAAGAALPAVLPAADAAAAAAGPGAAAASSAGGSTSSGATGGRSSSISRGRGVAEAVSCHPMTQLMTQQQKMPMTDPSSSSSCYRRCGRQTGSRMMLHAACCCRDVLC